MEVHSVPLWEAILSYQQILIQWKQIAKKYLKYVRKTRELVHIIFGGEEIVSTPDHPYYVAELDVIYHTIFAALI